MHVISRKPHMVGGLAMLLCAFFWVGCAQSVESRQAGQKIEFAELISGPQASFFASTNEPGYLLVADAKQWQAIAKSAGLDSVPDVDFSSERVLVLALGQKRTGGYGVRLKTVDMDTAKKMINAVVQIIEPEPGAMVTQMLSRPFVAYRLKMPQDSLPGEKAVALSLRFWRADGKEKQKLNLSPLALK